jgi:hypothetical protein
MLQGIAVIQGHQCQTFITNKADPYLEVFNTLTLNVCTNGIELNSIAPLFLRKIFPGILLEKSAKMTRRSLPSATPAVLLRSPHHYVTPLRK